MNSIPLYLRSRRAIALLAMALVVPLAASCATSGNVNTAQAGVPQTEVSGETPEPSASTSDREIGVTVAVEDDSLGAVGALESGAVHTIELTVDPGDFAAMLETYTASGEKAWIEATIAIDGVTYERVGIRLKGNSSLRSLARTSPTSIAPESLPWLVKLDKYIDGQDHDGLNELVVRSNSSATSINEAVALELLDLAGLASQDAIAAAFSVNQSSPVLRLVIESPDNDWMSEELGEDGALYKAESTGDWSYRGDDPAAYTNVFDQEAGSKNADLTPLIEFLDFVNNSDDATFKTQLGQHLDIDSFTTYLAMQELLNNFDDIDGPGNNSYLYYDTGTQKFTVVPWDYNLAFGASPAGAGGAGGARNQNPTNAAGPAVGGAAAGAVGAGAGPRGRANVLVQRFLAVPEWQALYQKRQADLRAELFSSGVAASVVEQWKAIVSSSNLVAAATVTNEAARIAQAVA